MITNAELQGYDGLTCTVLKSNIDSLKAIEEPKIGKWIPCSERFPENIEDESVQYLITVKVGENEYEIDFGWWSKISQYDNSKRKWVDLFGWVVGNDWDDGQGMEVIAWKPKPGPYKP